MSCRMHETDSSPERASGSIREAIEHLLVSMDSARELLDELRVALGGNGCSARSIVLATTAALGVHESAVDFLAQAAAAHRPPPARYRVTCPECGAESVTEWTDVLPPGGVAPVPCSACGYMILSESEGDPVLVPDGG